MSDEIRKLEQERDYWKRVASYLASCHAATLSYDGTLKSCSASRRMRFESIVDKAAAMMNGQDWQMGLSYARSTPERAAKDCLDALAHVKEALK
jgi:hypothetical protein